ncbi:MAG: tyrosine--tRNA ligase [Planctomycetota bacterium]
MATASPTAVTDDLHAILQARGLVAQCTDERITDRLSRPVACYCGFDPTADSLHVGSLVPIMGLAHAQRCGHKPIVLVGGATGLVGDPSGKTEARQMLTPETIRDNAEAIAKQIGRFVQFGDGPSDAVLVNNLDWIGPMSWLDVLRDIGSKVSVNRMVTMESVKQRMHGDGSGISYLEFSYMLLQAIDFVELLRRHDCTVQLGGQDQWGNIVMGIELGRKLEDADLAGLTFPLVTKSDGGKFGKSESGNIWLDANRTPVFDFFQFWRNVDDGDVGRYLRYFTFLPIAEIERLEAAEGAEINAAKVRLAYEVTKLIHGDDEATKARDAAAGAFASGTGGPDVTGDAVPHDALPSDKLSAGIGVIDLIKRAGFASSNGEARRLIQGGGVRIGDEKVTDIAASVDASAVTDGFVLLRVGKKKLFRFDVA